MEQKKKVTESSVSHKRGLGPEDQTLYSLLKLQSTSISLLNSKEHYDIYLARHIFPALVPGLDALAREVERIMTEGQHIDQNVRGRFNPCIWLAEYLMRHNPKYGHHQDYVEKFQRYIDIEQIRRLWGDRRSNMLKLLMQQPFGKKFKKADIPAYVTQVDKRFELNEGLIKKFPIKSLFKFMRKDDQEIQFERFYQIFLEWVQFQEVMSLDEMNPQLL